MGGGIGCPWHVQGSRACVSISFFHIHPELGVQFPLCGTALDSWMSHLRSRYPTRGSELHPGPCIGGGALLWMWVPLLDPMHGICAGGMGGGGVLRSVPRIRVRCDCRQRLFLCQISCPGVPASSRTWRPDCVGSWAGGMYLPLVIRRAAVGAGL